MVFIKLSKVFWDQDTKWHLAIANNSKTARLKHKIPDGSVQSVSGCKHDSQGSLVPLKKKTIDLKMYQQHYRRMVQSGFINYPWVQFSLSVSGGKSDSRESFAPFYKMPNRPEITRKWLKAWMLYWQPWKPECCTDNPGRSRWVIFLDTCLIVNICLICMYLPQFSTEFHVMKYIN